MEKTTMNDLFFYVGLSCIATLFFLPALWVKFAFSGENFTLIKLCIAMTYNFIFVIVYWRYADEGYLPFIGTKDDLFMRTFAVIVVLAHLYAIPTPWKHLRHKNT
jgi:hypothetical protein